MTQGAAVPGHRLRRSGPTTPPSRWRHSPVTGICGSGIIEAIAEMRLAGLLDASGLIGSAEQTGTDALRAAGPHPRLPAARRHPRHPGRRARHPARQVRALCRRAPADGRVRHRPVDRIVLAGAFGAHISPKHAMILGMIPDCDLARVCSAGNAAGTGARIALLNVAARREVEALVTPHPQGRDRDRAALPGALRRRQRHPARHRPIPAPRRGWSRCPRSRSTPKAGGGVSGSGSRRR